MKQLNLLNIVRSNIKRRKKAYIFLIISIILAVSFAATMTMLGASYISSVNASTAMRIGYQDIIFQNAHGLPMNELVEKGIFSEYGTVKVIGYIMPDKKNIGNGLSAAIFDDISMRISNKQLIEGQFPQNAGEIAVEKFMLNKLGDDVQVGDKVTVTMAIPDGEGFLIEPVEKTYILTGIMHNQVPYITESYGSSIQPVYMDIPAAIVSEAEQIEPGGIYIPKYYAAYKNGRQSGFEFSGIRNDKNSPFHWSNTQYIEVWGFGDEFMEISNVGYRLRTVALFAALLLLCSGIGIAGAFSANIAERKRQIGFLRAVGATKRQVRRLLLMESIVLTVIAIPLGIVFSVVVIKLISSYIGNLFILTVNITTILLVAVFSALCVIVSSLSPLKQASGILPMQAIRDVDLSRKLRKKRLRSRAKYTSHKYIAARSVVLHRNRQMLINVLMTLSIIILLLGTNLLVTMIKDEIKKDSRDDFMLITENYYFENTTINYENRNTWITESDKRDIINAAGDAQVYTSKMIRVNLLIENASDYIYNLPMSYSNLKWMNEKSGAHERYLNQKELFGYEKEFMSVYCMGVDTSLIENLRPYVYDGEINMDKILKGEEIIIAVPRRYGYKKLSSNGWTIEPVRHEDEYYDWIKENDVFYAGDEIGISYLTSQEFDAEIERGMYEILPETFDKIDKNVKIGALVSNPDYLDFPFRTYNSCNVIMPAETFSVMGYESSYDSAYIRLNYDPDKETQKYIEDVLKEVEFRSNDVRLYSFMGMMQEDSNIRYTMGSFIIAAILLFFMISTGMINSVISANIRSNRFMIGTMRAVGATGEVIQKTFIWQLVNMIFFGIIAGGIISLLYYFQRLKAEPLIPHVVHWPIVIAALIVYSVIVFTVCYLNIHRKTKIFLKSSIAQNIRQF